MGSSHLTFQHENHLGSLWILRGWALFEGSQSEILHRHLPSGKPLPSLCHGLPQCSPEGTGWRPESESANIAVAPSALRTISVFLPLSPLCKSASALSALGLTPANLVKGKAA